MKKILATAVIAATVGLVGCGQDDAYVAAENARKAADNFEIMRRVVYYNAITDKIIMTTEGLCSVTQDANRISVICKVGETSMGNAIVIRNFYGRSDNTSYFVEQMNPNTVSTYHYRRTFKPQQILPDIDFRGDLSAGFETLTTDTSD